MLHTRDLFSNKRNIYKLFRNETLQASRLKLTQNILTKIVLITPPEKSNSQIQNFNLPGRVSNWCRLGYELSVVNITTDVVWISSN